MKLRLPRLYASVLGAGLLFDGALRLAPIVASDWREDLLHVATGLVLLILSLIRREIEIGWAAAIIGALYVALGVVGLTIDQPFGLQLGPGEHVFHVAVGLLALALGGWLLRQASLAAPQLHTAAPPVRPGNAPAARRRARHRPGKARGRSRRR